MPDPAPSHRLCQWPLTAAEAALDIVPDCRQTAPSVRVEGAEAGNPAGSGVGLGRRDTTPLGAVNVPTMHNRTAVARMARLACRSSNADSQPVDGPRLLSRRIRLLGAALLTLASAASARQPVRNALLCARFQNTSDTALKRLAVRIPVPVTNEYQQIYSVAVAPSPSGFQDIPSGGRVAYFDTHDLEPGHTAWAFMLIRCRLRTFRARKRARVRPLPDAEQERCLGSGPLFDPEAPEIAEMANAILPDRREPFDTVRRINEHLAAEFTYELDDEHVDAVQTLATKRGSCTELSRVFVALARHCRIPTRLVTGSRVRAKIDGYVDHIHHRWVEVFLPNHGWFPVDVSRNVLRGDGLAFLCGSDTTPQKRRPEGR